jgi:hypothetical protein
MSLFDFSFGSLGLDSFDDFFSSVSKYMPVLDLGAKVIGGIADYSSKKKQADRMTSAITRAENENAAAIAERAAQVSDRSKQEQNVRARAAMIEKARLKAIAAESGLTGASFNRAFNAEDWAAGQDIGQLQQNEAAEQRQLQREEAKIHAASNIDRSKIVSPSLFETGLGLIGAGLQYGRPRAEIKRESPGTQIYH